LILKARDNAAPARPPAAARRRFIGSSAARAATAGIVDGVERMEEPGTPRVDARAVPPRTRALRARWLGRIGYRDAWALQRALAAARVDGTLDEDQILLLEHDAVLTLGRHADVGHVIAPEPLLRERGIEPIRVERGGEVTYHGPGQLVAYPIVALAAPGADSANGGSRPLGVRPFVEALEGAMADTCAAAGIAAGPRPGHPGCWVDAAGPLPRKIGALGIRVARGVSFHGIALNVTTNLADFDLIDPCGMPGLRSTSLARERARAGLPGADADAVPSTASVAEAAAAFAPALARRLRFELVGDLPPGADATGERRALEALVECLRAPSLTPTPAGVR
jgi:lipoyl(octanoyl) transferase